MVRRPLFSVLDPAGLGGLLAVIGIWYLLSSMIGRSLPPPHEVIGNASANLLSSEHLPGIGLPRGDTCPISSTLRTTCCWAAASAP